MGVGLPGGLFNFFRTRARFSVGDVFRDASAEQQHFLGHHGHLTAKFRELVVAGIPTVDQQPAARRVIQAKQQ